MKWLFKPLLACLLLGAWIAPGVALADEEVWELYNQATGGDAQALKALEQAAAQGNVNAQFRLGAMYENGEGVPRDYARARRWYEKAAAQGNGWAQICLGVLYAEGHGVRQDYAQARAWFEKAAAQGEGDLPGDWAAPEAQYHLGMLDAGGLGGAQDYAQARQRYEFAAISGDPDAQYRLGLLYAEGKGGPQDKALALAWLQMAADGGSAEAVSALKRIAMREGDAGAQALLGEMYSQRRDYAQARRWYAQAAEQGHAQAQFKLGVLYDNCQGMLQDDEQARHWYEKAAAQGNAGAQINLDMLSSKVADLYRQAKTGDDNALKALEQAAAQGNVDAQSSLGWIYDNGCGVPWGDQGRTMDWYSKACAAGYQPVCEACRVLNESFAAPWQEPSSDGCKGLQKLDKAGE